MGMDVYGKNETNDYREEGGRNYFRSNVWWWRPLVDQMEAAAPALFAKVEHWGSNDCDGLDNAEDCIAMADALEAMKPFVNKTQKALDAMPDEECQYCKGRGSRFLNVEYVACNACQGTAVQRPRECSYPHDWEFTQEWISFLRGCGGFEIC
tara:strand:- start:420 stop:875 length:456 start_codon:yes stop_codon:yes gene_type:complete